MTSKGTTTTTARIESAAADLARLRRSVPELDQAWEAALRSGDDAKADDLARQRNEAQAAAGEAERRLVVLRDLRRDEIREAEEEKGKDSGVQAEAKAKMIADRIREALQSVERAEKAIARACDPELLSAWYGQAIEAQRRGVDCCPPERLWSVEVSRGVERAAGRMDDLGLRLANDSRLLSGSGGHDWLVKNVERLEAAEWLGIAERAGLHG